ncbi:MAG: hypothetical protein EOO07_04485 [Chitinophagaceae bacterium]|nr:MAG: hypothetical protein EOO07_04485 [Chitinophagaceae bacterium]
MRNKSLKIALIIAPLLGTFSASACEVCKRQHPKILKDIAHGTGPQNQFDYFIVGLTTLLVLLTFFYTIKMLIRPSETHTSHIKRLILNLESDETK